MLGEKNSSIRRSFVTFLVGFYEKTTLSNSNLEQESSTNYVYCIIKSYNAQELVQCMDMTILGIDEVGRGCWAGPLVVGAVILNKEIPGLTDSKLLNKKKRIELDQQIRESAEFVGLGWVEPGEIDQLGLTASMKLAISRAVQGAPEIDRIIIDGNINYLPGDPRAEAIIKADQKFPAVSASSIVAKVARDACMQQASQKYPDFGFDRHVGYGTAEHREALQKFGTLDIHRKSYKPIKGIMHGQA